MDFENKKISDIFNEEKKTDPKAESENFQSQNKQSSFAKILNGQNSETLQKDNKFTENFLDKLLKNQIPKEKEKLPSQKIEQNSNLKKDIPKFVNELSRENIENKEEGEENSLAFSSHILEKQTEVTVVPKAQELSKKRLGRGLASLIGENEMRLIQEPQTLSSTSKNNQTLEKIHENVTLLPIDAIYQNRQNPRMQFSDKDLEELANSIKAHGVLQPLLVRPGKVRDTYQLVAGERRWRASQIVGLQKVPVLIKDLDDKRALEVALIENVQRSDLNPIEEALGYKQLIDDFSYKQEELGKELGKSRSHISNLLRLLKLPTKIQEYLKEGLLSYGHARALINVENSEKLADSIIKEGLSVRQTEEMVQKQTESFHEADALFEKSFFETLKKQEEEIFEFKHQIQYIETKLKDVLQQKVTIQHNNTKNTGILKIKYQSLDDLESLYNFLSGEKNEKI